jgi:hypothetical protein
MTLPVPGEGVEVRVVYRSYYDLGVIDLVHLTNQPA